MKRGARSPAQSRPPEPSPFGRRAGVRFDRGVTLIEILLVMAIVVMLAAIALGYGPSASCGEDDAEELQRVAAQVAVALSNARLVDRLEQIGRETLQALARTAAIFWPSAATLMSRDTTLEDRDEESMQFLVLHKRI